jgi:hypothetical protein
MKTDAYTKIVLTVIACTLLVFLIQNTFGTKAALGQTPQTHRVIVTICDPEAASRANSLGQLSWRNMGCITRN